MCCKREMGGWTVYCLPLPFTIDEVSDQEKAFDSVSHKQLVCKLQHRGGLGGRERLTEKLMNGSNTKGKNINVKESNKRSSAGLGVGILVLFAEGSKG